MLVGLDVFNDNLYQEYRKNMKPILSLHEGGFGYDFKISEVLLSETGTHINRAFTIYFPNKAKMEAFFSSQAYLKVKEEYFKRSVASTTIISTYLKDC